MAAKYVLLDFFDDDPPSIDVGKTEWLDEEIDETNYRTWIGKEVMCSWHHGGGGKTKKRPDVTRCAANIICFGDDRNCLIKKRNTYASTGQLDKTLTPLGKGNRTKKPKRFYDSPISSDDDDDENEEPIIKKRNDKRQQASSLKAMESLRRELEGYPQEPNKTGKGKHLEEEDSRQVIDDQEKLIQENKKLKEINGNLERQIRRMNEAMACIDYLPDVLDKLKACSNRKRQKSDLPMSPPPAAKKPTLSTNSPSPCSSQEATSDSDKITLAADLQAPRSVVRMWTKGNIKKYVADALVFFFTREEMASHSLSGAVSNAFKSKPTKPALPKDITVPLIEHVMMEFGVDEGAAKFAIRAKLNTESKLWTRQHGQSD